MGGKNGISLKVPRDLTAFQEHLNRLPNFPFRVAAKDIANAMRNSTLRRFKNQVDSEGNPWPPSGRAETEGGLSGEDKATAKAMARFRGDGKQISGKTLIDTGRLRNSITTEATEDEARVGTNVVYARIHELGGAEGQPNATMPKRSYLAPSDDDIELAKKILGKHIDKALKGGKS